MGPVLEFSAGQQAPFAIVGPEIFIGRGAMCALRIDEAAAERHARLTVDAAGQVYIQDLDTHTGTLRNGNFVYGAQPLVEGDRIEIGGVALVFHAAVAAPVVAAAPPSPVMAPGRAGAADRTQLAGEVPPEVRAALAE